MGEEAKQEQGVKAEEKVEEKKEEKKELEEKVEGEPKPPNSPPFVLFVDLHCVGCAKKIERSIMKIRGVEGVAIDMGKNEVTIKGIVEAQAVCNKIMKKTKRIAKVLSPLPASEADPNIPQLVTSQVSGPVTVELNVNMHCEACAEQLKTKILKMRGVQTATTELSSGKVTVTGTMDANKLVDYVYRRTKKQARIVPPPQPQPQPQPEEKPEEPEKKETEKPADEEAKPEEKPAEAGKEEEKGSDHNKEEKSGGDVKEDQANNKEIINGSENIGLSNPNLVSNYVDHEENMKRMMYYYQPLYMIERIPPPQLFSDENPNACCIS